MSKLRRLDGWMVQASSGRFTVPLCSILISPSSSGPSSSGSLQKTAKTKHGFVIPNTAKSSTAPCFRDRLPTRRILVEPIVREHPSPWDSKTPAPALVPQAWRACWLPAAPQTTPKLLLSPCFDPWMFLVRKATPWKRERKLNILSRMIFDDVGATSAKRALL